MNKKEEKVLEYLLDKYSQIFSDNNLVKKFNLTISPDELQNQLYNKKTKVKCSPKNIVKNKIIREEIKNINSEEGLYSYFNIELINYFDKSIDENDREKILKSYSKAELIFLYKFISNVTLPNNKKKEDIVWLIKSYFDNKSRVEAMRL